MGAIVSPTDPLAATAILRRLGLPRRMVAVLEGESLVNDATALVAYRLAVAGSFSLWQAGLRFVVGAVGGVAIGLAVGWLIAEALRRIEDPMVKIVLSVVAGYGAYLPADRLGLWGVLAAVAAGLYVGWRAPSWRRRRAGCWGPRSGRCWSTCSTRSCSCWSASSSTPS